VLGRYSHLFPEADAVLRDHLDVLFVSAAENRRNTTA
jgi:hypothetical protein